MISRNVFSSFFRVSFAFILFLDYSSILSKCDSEVASLGLTKFLPVPDKYGVRSVVPNCAFNFTQQETHHSKSKKGGGGHSGESWCLHDYDYPKKEIENALFYHFHAVAQMYKDVLVDTSLSVNGISSLTNELYLCPAKVDYVQPLRALNSNGEWRIIVNQIQAKDGTLLTQSVRFERCLNGGGQPCPKIPACYDTECVQKFTYHRLLIFNPFEYYLPFAMETFRFPVSCDCYTATYHSIQEAYTFTKKGGEKKPTYKPDETY